MSNNNNPKTIAFETVNKSALNSRRKLVIAIFVVVILILAAFATLIIGKILTEITPIDPPTPDEEFTSIPKDAGDYKIGNLLFVNGEFSYQLTDFSNMVNLKAYQNKAENSDLTQINNCFTYSLTSDRIVLESNTLIAFNQMILDYCKTLNLSGADSSSASNIEVAWGGYSQSTLHEYEEDINSTSLGKDYYDHILGTSLTLKMNGTSSAITESVLKNDFTWIYENAHKYGFVIRYPDACKDHTGYDGAKRVHLRYIGIEHASYIHENNICLEEYLTALRTKYSSSSPLSFTAANGKSYSVYYVAYSGNPTNVPVPKNSNYTISGDNMNGFIVTVEK